MFDGILFDLDGTLWDAVPEITISWNLALARNQVERPPLTVDEVRSCMGLRIADIAARRLPGLNRQRQLEIIEECCAVENEDLAEHGAAVYPEVEETLSLLSRRSPLLVVSNCQDGYIQAFFQGTGLGRYFQGFECAGRTGKPKSQNIALTAARYGLKKPVYVGDTELDWHSAREAGVAFIHAAYGFGTVPPEVPSISAFSQLPALLERLG